MNISESKNRYPADTETAIGKADEHSAEIETLTQEQSEAIKRINEIWKRATSANSNHQYIKKKRIHPMGARQIRDSLIIPICRDFGDHGDTLVSLQYIQPSGEKKFHPNCPITGGFYIIGNITDTDMVYVVEGFATGATVFEATDVPVVVAFNSGNIQAVCTKIKAEYPKMEIIIAADNDIESEKKHGHNSGKESATATAKELGVKFVLCPVNSDFNDLFNEQYNRKDGLKAVRLSLRKIECGCIYDDVIHHFNSKYAMTWLGGKCVILKEQRRPETGELDLNFTSDTDLRKFYANRLLPDPEEPKKTINPVDFWLKSPQRRQYKEVVFEPGKDLPGYYNLEFSKNNSLIFYLQA